MISPSPPNNEPTVTEHIEPTLAEPCADDKGACPSAEIESEHEPELVDLFPKRSSTAYSVCPETLPDRRANLRHRTLPSSAAATRGASAGKSGELSGGKDSKEAAAGSSAELPKKEDQKDADESGAYECNICLDMASNPVVTPCGHLFCWPCLSRWMKTPSQSNNTCPVCKSGIEKDKLVPIYSKGRTVDPRNVVEEERPSGTRTEAPPTQGNGYFGGGIGMNGFGLGFSPMAQFNLGGTNIAFSAGFGPFGLILPLIGLGMQYAMGNGGVAVRDGAPVAASTRDARAAQIVAQQAFISRVFMLISILVFIAIALY